MDQVSVPRSEAQCLSVKSFLGILPAPAFSICNSKNYNGGWEIVTYCLLEDSSFAGISSETSQS